MLGTYVGAQCVKCSFIHKQEITNWKELKKYKNLYIIYIYRTIFFYFLDVVIANTSLHQ